MRWNIVINNIKKQWELDLSLLEVCNYCVLQRALIYRDCFVSDMKIVFALIQYLMRDEPTQLGEVMYIALWCSVPSLFLFDKLYLLSYFCEFCGCLSYNCLLHQQSFRILFSQIKNSNLEVLLRFDMHLMLIFLGNVPVIIIPGILEVLFWS